MEYMMVSRCDHVDTCVYNIDQCSGWPWFLNSPPSLSVCQLITFAFNMAVGSVFARHPRYALSVAVGLLVTLLLLASQHDPVHAGPSYHQFDAYDTPIRTVGAKLKEAETIYQGVLEQRKALITKFGPKVDDIVKYAHQSQVGE